MFFRKVIEIMRRIDRFDLYMKARGLNDNKVCTQLGLSNGTIGKSRNAGRDLSDRVLERIEKFYTDLNPEWLRHGTGDMLIHTPKKTSAYSPDDSIVLTGDTKLLVMQMSATLNQQEENIARLTELVTYLATGAPGALEEPPKKDMAG